MKRRSGLGRLLSRPAVHFLVLGSVLYLGEPWLAEIRDAAADEADGAELLTLSAARREQLRGQWQLTAGRQPTAGEEEWLIRQWAEEEMLYREALRLGLDRDDPGVCRRLAINLRFLGLAEDAGPAEPRAHCRRARELGLDRGDPVIRRQMAELMRLVLEQTTADGTAPESISSADLEDYVDRHRERFLEPARVRLSHVFLSRAERGADLGTDARRLLARLTVKSAAPRRAVAMADPFLGGHHPPPSSERDLERIFGPGFAARAIELAPRQWSGPVRSAYGLHLVWIHERFSARLPPLELVREQAALGLDAERAEARLESALDELRSRWRIHLEDFGVRS